MFQLKAPRVSTYYAAPRAVDPAGVRAVRPWRDTRVMHEADLSRAIVLWAGWGIELAKRRPA